MGYATSVWVSLVGAFLYYIVWKLVLTILPEQNTVVGTLETIVDIAREQEIANPSIILVGDVVNLRNGIRWFESDSGS
ncbi:hypothetical protein CIG75_03815 [Tumebacillus algifaecis]|uniref:Uncharacterized protein n=1 Tax=Tumebacillus algifaecis TaxID=1214604 RepID=A0A223CYL1_9BACL|nr:hypothetical protein CIG75_03815 [Tumebacillus algifaecis]